MINDKNLKCVVICGGKGKRLGYTNNTTKSLIPINNKPMLWHIIEYWKKFTDDFIFVFDNSVKDIMDYVKTLPINSRFIIEKEPKGIANALFQAKDYVGDNFIVSLGDCVCNGSFDFPKRMEWGIGIWETDNLRYITSAYSVEVKNGYVQRVVEKPKTAPNNLCGMGFYFFNRKVFDYIKSTKPSELTGKVELTDVIQTMIDVGEKISSVFFNGKYVNINYPEDLEKARKILF